MLPATGLMASATGTALGITSPVLVPSPIGLLLVVRLLVSATADRLLALATGLSTFSGLLSLSVHRFWFNGGRGINSVGIFVARAGLDGIGHWLADRVDLFVAGDRIAGIGHWLRPVIAWIVTWDPFFF